MSINMLATDAVMNQVPEDQMPSSGAQYLNAQMPNSDTYLSTTGKRPKH